MGKGTFNPWLVLSIAGASVAAFVGGCAHSAAEREPDLFRTAVFAPLPPAFIGGPVAMLFTNYAGFTARVHATGSVPGETGPLSGQIFARGSRLLFAPDPKTADDEKPRRGEVDPGFSFLWDVSENKGWLLSEALQAYAPVSSQLRYSAVEFPAGETSGSAPGELKATLAGGTVYSAIVSRGPDNFPARITAGTNETAMTVALSRVRMQVPPMELFVVPKAFTAYSSAEALVDELAMRQRGLNRKGELEGVPLAPPPLPNDTPRY